MDEREARDGGGRGPSGMGGNGARRSRGASRQDAGALWRNLTDSMLAVSRRMPGIGRASAAAQQRRAVNRGWEAAERAAPGGLWGAAGDDAAGMDGGDELGGLDDLGGGPLPSELWEQQSSRATGKRGLFSRRVSYPVLVVLLLLSLLLSFFGTDSVLRVFDALAAVRDAKAQVALIEAELKGGDVTSTDHLVYVQTHLTILGQDVTRIQGDIPLEPLVAHAPGGSGIAHVLAMAQDMVQAGQAGIGAALILIPSLKGLLHGIGDSTTASANQPPAITTTQIQQAASDVDTATALVQAAVQERQQVSDSDLSSVGMGSLVPMLHKLDALTPKLGEYFGAAKTMMGALPALLGLTKPINFLLFNMDSDELRGTGGFMGNYAVLTLSGGRLQGGVHLRDITLLDCPNGNCVPRALPPQFAWFPFATTSYGTYFDVRDSNLDPDFPSSARLAMQYAQQEGAPPISGVISMTPTLIEDILQVTGSIKVSDFNVTVTPQNLQDTIHYFHVLTNFCMPPSPHLNDPRCLQLAGAAGAATDTSNRKVFDAVLGSTLLHAVGALTPQQQSLVFKVILGAIQTKDLQVYFSDPQMESALSDLHVDSTVATPQGDSFFVVDTNISASYVNGDIQEQIADKVSLDATGTATHNLTISYTFPIVNHSWSDIYSQSDGYFAVRDVVRVIVPQNAKMSAPTGGCEPIDAPEAKHGVIACEMILDRQDQPCVYNGCGSYSFQGSATLHFSWSVPNAVQVANGGRQYSLLVQKQAGTHSTVSITITPPAQSSIASLAPTPDATPNPGAIAGSVSKGAAIFAGQLSKDVTLSLAY